MSAGKDEVKLLSVIYSPYAQRVLISLREKGIPFETITCDLTNKPQELLDANPIWKKVPTLVHNGKSVPESHVIVQYIEDAWPEKTPLLPEDAFGKSQMRFWVDYVGQLFTNSFGRPLVFSKPGAPEREAARTACAKGLKVLEGAMSAEGPFFSGKTFGFVDAAMAPFMARLPVMEHYCELTIPGPDELPRFYKWCDAMWAHPSVKDSLPTKEDNLAFFGDFIKRYQATAGAAANGK